MDLRYLFNENECPRVERMLGILLYTCPSSCCDFLILNLGKKLLGSSSSLKGFFLVCFDINHQYIKQQLGVFGLYNVLVRRGVVL
jgi:hypothetical protein